MRLSRGIINYKSNGVRIQSRDGGFDRVRLYNKRFQLQQETFHAVEKRVLKVPIELDQLDLAGITSNEPEFLVLSFAPPLLTCR